MPAAICREVKKGNFPNKQVIKRKASFSMGFSTLFSYGKCIIIKKKYFSKTQNSHYEFLIFENFQQTGTIDREL